jgi:hypothetical protein
MKPPSLAKVKLTRPVDVVPDGWFTRQQLEKEWRLSTDYTGKIIRDSVLHGRCDMKKFLVLTRSRGLYPTQHYKFKTG